MDFSLEQAMPKISFLHSVWLLGLWVFASIVTEAEGKQKEQRVGIIETRFFTVHHALEPDELSRFKRIIIPHLDPFVDHWLSQGFLMPNRKVKLVIEPDPNLDGQLAFNKIFGESFFDDLRDLKKKVDTAKTVKGLISPVTSFGCKYPPLLMKVFVKDSYRDPMRLDLSREYFQAKINQVLTEPPNFDGENPAFAIPTHFAPYPRGCRETAIVLGRSKDLDRRPHVFLTADIVLHEIGHALFIAVWEEALGSAEKSRKLLSDASFVNEMIADILAHTYLGTACHGLRFDDSGQPICGRRLDAHELNLWNLLKYESISHKINAPVRHFFWELFKEIGIKRFSKVMAMGVLKVPKAMLELNKANEDPLDLKSTFFDGFLDLAKRYKIQFKFLEYFGETVCHSSQSDTKPWRGICGDFEDYLGKQDWEYVAGLQKNSPTWIGDKWRKTTFDGAEASIRFVSKEAGDLHAFVRQPSSGTILEFKYNGIIVKDGGEIFLEFRAIDSESSSSPVEYSWLWWTWDGTLVSE